MSLAERRARLLEIALARRDLLAVATLRPSQRWSPEPTDYVLLVLPRYDWIWQGLRWAA